MNNFELVEKLVNTFGVSYEEAKNALESCNWDPIEAAVVLEKGKNGKQESEEQKTNQNVKGSYETIRNDWKEESSKFFTSIWNFLSLNEFVVKKSSGELFLNIPIWLAVVLVCAFFWPVVLVMGIVFIMGYRFSFTGPQLGRKNVQDTVNHVESVGEDFVEKVKNSVSPDIENSKIKEEARTEEMPVENQAEVPSENPENTGEEKASEESGEKAE